MKSLWDDMYKKLDRSVVSHGVRQDLLLFVFAFFLGGFCFKKVSPLGSAVVCGAFMSMRNQLVAAAGALLGAIISGNIPQIFSLLVLVLLYIVWSLKNGAGILRRDKLLILVVAELSRVACFCLSSVNLILTGLLGAAIAVVAAILLQNGFIALSAVYKKRLLSVDEQASLCMITGIAVLSLSQLAPWGFSLSAMLAALVSVYAARVGGVAFLCASVTAGLFHALCTGLDLVFVAGLAICMLCGSMLRRAGKWGSLLAFLVGTVALCSRYADFMHVPEICVAAVIYMFTPQRVLYKMGAHVSVRRRQLASQRKLDTIREKLLGTAYVLCDVADAFCASTGGEVSDTSLAFVNRQLNAVSGVLKNIADDDPAAIKAYTLETVWLSTPKDAGVPTGDSFEARTVGTRSAVVLSDGMGSGKKARMESTLAVSMFYELLGVEYDAVEALECVNRLLIARANDMYATFDAFILDATTGAGDFIKFGAPPSFIVREGRAKKIYGEALPIGIVEQATPAVHCVNLHDGDYIVQLTDGAFDVLGVEFTAAIVEKLTDLCDMKFIAQEITDAAFKNGVSDDMTVAISRVNLLSLYKQ